MKITILTTLILIYSSFIYSQERVITGKITDSLNNPIKYVNIGILNKSIGTVSGENGHFNLIIDTSMRLDTLKVSCLGYKSKEIIIKDILSTKGINISLLNLIEQLEEVIVTPSKLKTYTDGKLKTNTKQNVIFANSKFKNKNLGTEIGRKFKLGKKKNSYLNEFKFFIKDNNFDFVKFRINIYSIKNNKPYKKLNNKNIIIKVSKNYTDWVIIDLEKYNIIVKQDIIITTEWIEHSENGDKLNLPMIIPSFGSTHFYRFGSQSKWEKYGKISSSMFLTYQQ